MQLLSGTESSGLLSPHLRRPCAPTCCAADALADGLLGGTAGWTVEQDEEEVPAQVLPRQRWCVQAKRRDRGDGGPETPVRLRGRDRAASARPTTSAWRKLAARGALRRAGSTRAIGARSTGRGSPETIHGAISVKEPGSSVSSEYDERRGTARRNGFEAPAEISPPADCGLDRPGTGGLRFVPGVPPRNRPSSRSESERGARARAERDRVGIRSGRI